MSARRPWGTIVDRQVLASPTHDAAKALLAYWRQKCPPGGLPRRTDIVAAEIPLLLPDLMIIEPVVGVSDWEYRLVGQRLVTRYGFDWTGKHMSALLDDATAAEAIRFYDAVAAARAPAIVTGRMQAKGDESVLYECAALPILGRDGTSVWVLLGVFFHN
jgi:hypothetical protein